MVYSLANLSNPPGWMMAFDGDINTEWKEWTQPSRLFTVIYYHHQNAVTMNGRTFEVIPSDMVFIAAGARVAHAKVGDGCKFDAFSFDLPGTNDAEVAVPVHIRGRAYQLDDLIRARDRITISIRPASAFVWNLLWNVSQSTSMFREQEVLYLAEEYVRRNLERKFTVSEMADDCKTNHRKLLTAFRLEHGISIQEYILRARIQEASRLLLNSDLSIKAVAARVGYTDLQEFNKVIRVGTGTSPRQFRGDGTKEHMRAF